jgi:hypothetical protein
MGVALFLLFAPPHMLLKGVSGEEFKTRLKIIRRCAIAMLIAGAIIMVGMFL